MKIVRIFRFVLLLILLSVTTSFAALINVPADQGTVQAGLNAASPGDTVLVATGTYYENITWPAVDGIVLTSSGGRENTIIDGSGSDRVITIEQNSVTTATVISGFTIQNGSSSYMAGGILLYDSSPTLTDLIVTNNTLTTSIGGNAIGMSDSQGEISHSIISYNTGSAFAGGLFMTYQCSPSMDDLLFIGNSGNEGGAIYNDGSTLNITNSKFINNSGGQAGALREAGNPPNLSNLLFYGNSGPIGAIKHGANQLTLSNVTFERNSSPELYAAGNQANSIVAHNCNFENSTGTAVQHDGWGSSDVTNNWWGSATGPAAGQAEGLVTSSPYLTTPDIVAPVASPSNFAIERVAFDEAKLSWDSIALSDFDHFELFFDNDASGAPYSNSLNVGSDTTYTLNNIPQGVTLYFAIKCFDSDGNESWYSNEVTFEVFTTINVPADYATIQDGLDTALSGDTVLVASGTYTEYITWPAVNGIKLHSSDGAGSTIIDADGYETVLKIDNPIIDGDTEVSGFTLINGDDSEGGGINCSSSSPTFTDLIIENNRGVEGGGVYLEGSSATFTDIIVRSNRSDGDGGGFYISDNSQPTITRVEISDNYANTFGGGIYISASSPSISNLTMFGNSVDMEGNGIFASSSTPASNLFLTNSNILNPVEAIVNDGPGTIDIPQNWWGTGGMPVAGALVGGIIIPSLLTTPDPIAPPPPPTGIAVEKLPNNSVKVTWNDMALSDMSKYVVFWDNDASGAPYANYMDQLGNPEYTITNLTPNTTYFVAVQVWDTDGNKSRYSEEKSKLIRYNFTVPDEYATIQEALDACNTPGDTVQVAPGTYTENIIWPELNGIFLYSPVLGYTVINGDASGSVISFNSANLDYNTRVSGFTITNGSADWGGGIYCRLAAPSLDNLHIYKNTANNGGGGIYIDGGALSLDSLLIERNSSGDIGGGIYNYAGSLMMNNCTLVYNTAVTNANGIYYYEGAETEVSVYDCNFVNSPGVVHVDAMAGAEFTDNWWGSADGPQSGDVSSMFPNTVDTYDFLTSPDPIAPVPPPSGLTVTRTSATSFDLTWNDLNLPDFGWYMIHYDTDQSGAPYSNVVDALTDTTYSLSGLTVGQTYYFAVTCVDDSEHMGPFSQEVSAEATYIINVPVNYTTIQEGLNNAFAGDTVLVAPGTYVENLNWPDVDSIMLLSSGDQTNTIIDGDASGPVITFNNVGDGGLINGFTIQNGLADAGGGIYGIGTIVRLQNSIIKDNSANHSGGGIHLRLTLGAPSIFENVEIIGNSAISYGGGIYGENVSIVISNALIAANSAGSSGGGIFTEQAILTLSTTTIEDNNAVTSGDGILISDTSGLVATTIVNSNLVNSGETVVNIGIHTPNLINNWWGSASGPEAGDVTGSASTSPWLTVPNVDAPTVAPTGLRYVRTAYNAIRLVWDISLLTDFDHCEIYWDNDGPGYPYSNTASTSMDTSRTYSIDNLILGENYYFAVKAVDDDGNASWFSSEVSFTSTYIVNIPADHGTIQAGLNAAFPADTVLVAPGTYVENIAWPNVNGITLLASSSDPDSTIIDGNASNYCIYFYDLTAVIDSTTLISGFTVRNGTQGIMCFDESPSFKDLIVTDNNNSNPVTGTGMRFRNSSSTLTDVIIKNNTSTSRGAGLYAFGSSSLTLTNVEIDSNTAALEGGGMVVYDSSPTLINVTINGNSSTTKHAGGILLYNSSPTLTDVTINGNSAATSGGGIYCENSSSPTITGGSITNNSVDYDGGGIYCVNSSSPILNDVTVTGNSANDVLGQYDYGNGGGIFSNNSTLEINGGSFTGNTASTGGGGIFIESSSSLTVIGASISDNEGTGGGGGILSDSSTVTLTDVTISNNTSPYESSRGGGLTIGGATVAMMTGGEITSNSAVEGGGIYQGESSSATLTDVTISSNSADEDGGGVFSSSSTLTMNGGSISSNNAIVGNGYGGGIYGTASTVTLTDTKISTNIAKNGGGVYALSSTVTFTSNIALEGNYATTNYGGIYLGSESSLTMIRSSLINNRSDGTNKGIYYSEGASTYCIINLSNLDNVSNLIIANGDASVDARYNWWQHPSGPQSGVAVGANVDTGSHLAVPEIVAPPVPPINVSISEVVHGAISIEWDESLLSDLVGYKVYICEAADYQDFGTGIDVGTANTHTFTGLNENENYSVAVTAYDTDGNESWFSPYLDERSTTTLNVPSAEYATIQSALDAAAANDTIYVAPGTYTENLVWPDVNGIILTSSGDSTDTFIDGGGSGSVINFNHTSIDSNTVVSGFTIQNGNNSDGGGIFMFQSSPSIRNCLIKDNTSNLCGAGILMANATFPVISSTTITNNQSSREGGGIYSYNSTPILRNVTIDNNTSISFGGGLYIELGSPLISASIISRNNANDSNGGGIACVSSSPTFSDVTLEDNHSYLGGGGIYFDNSSSAVLTDVRIFRNETIGNGGGLRCITSSPTLTNVQIVGNWANGWGGGISFSNTSSTPVFSNVTISQNSGDQGGGGIYIDNSSLTISGICLDRNTTQGWAVPNSHAILVQSGTPTIVNSNIGIIGQRMVCSGGSLTATNNWWGTSSGPSYDYDLGMDDVTVYPNLTAPDPNATLIPPSGLAGSDKTNTSIMLTWNSSILSDLAGYKVHYGIDSDGYSYTNSIDVGTDTTYQLYSLTPGGNYSYAVTMYDDDGNESWFSEQLAESIPNPMLINVPADYTTIQAALGAASWGDTIHVDGGQYQENLNWPDTYGIKLVSVGEEPAEIIGDGTTHVIEMWNMQVEIDTNTVISGFNIRNGGGDTGGGMKISGASPKLVDLNIHDNNVTSEGGGLYITWNSAPHILNSHIYDNSASSSGGGICVRYNSSPTLQNVTISNNSATGGGGIAHFDSSPILRDVIVSDNYGNWYGGGIYSYISSSTLTDVLIINNSSTGTINSHGGGYSANRDTTSMTRVSFIGNTSNGEGAALKISHGEFTITNSIFDRNVSGKGRSIWVEEGLPLEFHYSNLIDPDVQLTCVQNGVINGENIWWGDPSGPAPGTIAGSASNPVPYYANGTINYEPFLTEPDPDAPPLPVSGLTVTDSAASYMDLTWDASPLPDVAGYKVKTCLDNIIDVGNVTSYRNGEVFPSGTDEYSWAQVLVYDTDGNESVYLDTVKTVPIKCWVDSLRIALPEVVSNVVSDTFQFKFRSECDLPHELIDYKVQVSSHSDFSSIDMWDLDWVGGPNIVYEDGYSQTVTYRGIVPLDGETYYLRIKTRNDAPITGMVESVWSDTLTFRMNTPPTVPAAPFNPSNDVLVSSAPTLTFIASDDLEGDGISYEFNVYDDEALTNRIRTIDGVEMPLWQVDPVLPQDVRYWWDARAWDGLEWSDYSPAQSFITNDSFSSPAAFSLVSPSDASINITGIETLTWNSTTDSDFGDTVSYYVHLSKTDDFSAQVEVLFTENDTTIDISDLANGQTYYWKVHAQDTNTEGTWSSETWSFTIQIPGSPEPFALESPPNEMWIGSDTVELTWLASADDDPGDSFHYEVQWGIDPDFTVFDSDTTSDTTMVISNLAVIAEALSRRGGFSSELAANTKFDSGRSDSSLKNPSNSGSQSMLDALPDDTVIYWRVKAVDTQGHETWAFPGMPGWVFETNYAEYPEPFSLVSPDSGFVSSSNDVTLMWQSTIDNDPWSNEFIEYIVVVTSDTLDPEVAQYHLTIDTTLTLTNLPDNTTFYWYVHAQDDNTDGTMSNEFWSFSINVPDNPEAFALVSPSNNANVETDTVQVNWSPSSDIDPGDELTYHIQWSNDAGFENYESATTSDTFFVITDFTSIVEEGFSGSTRFDSRTFSRRSGGSALDALPDDTTIYWRVKVVDSNDNVRWAFPGVSGWSFNVNVVELPSMFSLLGPADGSTCLSGDTTLVWQSSANVDAGDEISYVIYTASDAGFTTDLDSLFTPDTTISVNDVAEGSSLYWKVRAQDENSWGTWSNETWSFSVHETGAPDPFNLLSPVDGFVSQSKDVTMYWDLTSDPDPNDHVSYILYLATDSLFISVDSIEVQNVYPSYNYYNATNLLDDTTYWWKVRAQDESSSGTWSNQTRSFSIDVPENPDCFVLHMPFNGAIVADDTTTLRWYPATDVDPGDVISYVIQWADNPEFISPAIATTSDTFYVLTDLEGQILEGIGSGSTSRSSLNTGMNSGSMLDALPDDTIIYWRVKAVDQYNNITYALPGESGWSFTVEMDEFPMAFSLLSPDDGSVCTTGDTTLTWEASSDPDPGVEISYIVYLATDISFANVDSIEVNTTSYVVSNLLDDTQYWWKVRAQDANTVGTWSNEVKSFTVNIPEGPDDFALHLPPNYFMVLTDTVEVSWYQATDVDPGDVITYTVEWSTSYLFHEGYSDTTRNLSYTITDLAGTLIESIGGQNEPTDMQFSTEGSGSALDALPDDTMIYWRVKATDQYGNYVYAIPGEQGRVFMVWVPEAPSAFSLLSPVDGSTCLNGDTTLVWQAAIEPDTNDEIEYVVYTASDAGFTTDLDSSLTIDTTFTVYDLPEGSSFFWKVRAQDNNTSGTWSSESWSLDVYHRTSPVAFSLVGPDSGSVNTTGEETLRWYSSSDADPGDELSYVLYLDTDETFANATHIEVEESLYVAVNLLDDTTYWWKVKAVDSNTDGTWSSEAWSFSVDKPAIPEPFTLLTPANEAVFGVDSARVSWSASSDADPGDVISYELQYTFYSDFTYLVNTVTTSDTTMLLTSLGDDATYRWRVKAIDSDGNFRWAMPGDGGWTFSISVADAPYEFSLASPDSGSICSTGDTTLTWHPSTDIDPGDGISYIVYLGTDAAFATVDSFTVTDTSYSATNLLDDTTYWWKVRAQDSNTDGTWSSETWSFNVDKPAIPEPFTLLTPANEAVFGVDSARVSWSASSDADPGDVISYELQYTFYSDFTYLVNTVTTSDTTMLLTSLGDDATYRWRVKAIDSDGNFRWAMPGDGGWTFSISVADAPYEFSLASPDSGSICSTGDTTLTWHPSTDIDPGDGISYIVYLGTDAAFATVDSFTVTDTSYSATNLLDDTTYWWKVRAQDSNTDGTWSSETWSFSVDKPAIPDAFTLLSPSNGIVVRVDTVQVVWSSSSDDDPNDVLTYEIQWSSDADFTNYQSDQTFDTTFVLTDLDEPIAASTSGRSKFSVDSDTEGNGSGLDELPDDTSIYWRVKVIDNYNLERWSEQGETGWSFAVDLISPPASFSLIGPDGEVCTTGDTTLVWYSSSDPDPNDALSYVICISPDENFTSVDSTVLSDTTFVLNDLLDDTTFWWKVRAQDTNTSGTWSNEVYSFTTAIPERPEPFVLLSPSDGEIIEEQSVNVVWSASSDNDPEDSITYEINWSTDPDFASFNASTLTGTSFTLTNLNDDSMIFWRVKAIDSFGLYTWSMAGEDGWMLEIDIPQPPLPFSLSAPEDELELDTLAWTFFWEETVDPDPNDQVNYLLSLSLVEDFEDTMTVHYNAEMDTSFPVPYMLDDTDYWWRVAASDNNGDFTLSDETWTFHTAWPEPPHPFELDEGGIDMNETGDSIVVSLTWHRTWDPDPESLEYYAVMLDTTDDMDIPIVLEDSVLVGGTDSTFTWTKTYAPEELPMLGNAYWTVYAYDNNTDGTWADNVMTMFLTSVNENPWGNIPFEYEFASAYPNPFNPTLTAVISLPDPSDLTVTVFNVMGQRVATIAEGQFQSGFHSLVFDGGNMASGVYFIHASVPGKLSQVKKVILMK